MSFVAPPGTRRGLRDWTELIFKDHGFLRIWWHNLHEVAPGMWRSNQPGPSRVHAAAGRGIRTIVNLRGLRNHERQPGFYFLEEEAAKRHGIRLVNFRAYSREAPKPEFILGLAELFDSIEYPALLHCKSGADRAGLASALYLFLRAERPLDEALRQLTFRYGHVRHGKTGVLGAFFDAYREAARAEGAEETPEHFLSWVREEYDRDAVQAAFRPTTLGALLTEHVLRRE